MRRSFYHYILTQRGHRPNDPVEAFAESVAKDIMFPKHSDDYHEITDYLELSVDYLDSMDLFDQLWDKYIENNK
ncbi:YozE family protein [Enterococcus gilvus]|uniref:YozE family protein n=1 Tax=Enterococcus gilvus TaxID=160453 RepID=UPI0028D89912|nr:YozE family protein [Enterococcus gilvus]